jgi:cytochrome P450
MENKYLEAVIKESLRLMPIGAIVARTPKEPFTLEGVTIYPGNFDLSKF